MSQKQYLDKIFDKNTTDIILKTLRPRIIGQFSFVFSTNHKFCYSITEHNKTLYATSHHEQGVLCFDADTGNFIKTIKMPENDPFHCPNGLAVDENILYVTDGVNHRVCLFNVETGDFLKSFGKWGKEQGKLDRPHSILIFNDFIYITEFFNHRISVFGKHSLNFLFSFGEKENLKQPSDICTNDKDFFVADWINGRIIVYTLNGEYKKCLGENILRLPHNIVCHGEQLIVTEYEKCCVTIFNPDTGKHIKSFGKRGMGKLNFDCPAGIAVYNDTLYVVDEENCRICVYY